MKTLEDAEALAHNGTYCNNVGRNTMAIISDMNQWSCDWQCA